MLVQNDKSMRATICSAYERYMNGEMTEKQYNAALRLVTSYAKITLITHGRVKAECMAVETNKKYGSDIELKILDTKIVD